jgi:hypothetical protein
LAVVADFGTQNFHFKTKFDMEDNTSTNHENGNDANRLLPAVNIQEMDELLQSNFNEFRLALGLLPDNLSERAKEYFRKAMEEYSQKQLQKFCDHINTYKGFEDCRFDFMLVDFQKSV